MHFNQISEGINQSVVIVLPVSTENKEKLENSKSIVLRYKGKPYAIMRQLEFFLHHKEERVARQFGTTNPDHPYIKVKPNMEKKLINRNQCSVQFAIFVNYHLNFIKMLSQRLQLKKKLLF